jgi:hypothetical protein
MNAQQTKLNATAAELTHKEVCNIASAGETVVGLLFWFPLLLTRALMPMRRRWSGKCRKAFRPLCRSGRQVMRRCEKMHAWLLRGSRGVLIRL